MRLSIVTTLYNSAPFVEEFHARARAAAQQIVEDYEILFVNDGSPDASLETAIALAAGDEKVTVIDLSRNFGHHHAIVAGLAHARGERVFLIDVDLEEQPEWLLDFAREMERSSADVVFGVQRSRTGSLFNARSGAVFYKLFNLFSETKIPENPCTVRLMSREYVAALLELRDRNLFLAGVFQWAGFKQQALPVDKKPRHSAPSYTLPKRFALFVNALTSFTSYPLILIFLVGLSLAALFGLMGIALVVNKLLNPSAILLGWSSVIVSIWFLSGLIICFIGIVGVYVSKMFVEVKHRPQYIVRRIYGNAGQRPRAPDGRAVSIRLEGAEETVGEANVRDAQR